jgi:hypothetical protein
MALFITLGLISRPSAKMLSLAQHADYAQHLSVYAISCTVQAFPFLPFVGNQTTDHAPILSTHYRFFGLFCK